jgi:hypothetical protein
MIGVLAHDADALTIERSAVECECVECGEVGHAPGGVDRSWYCRDCAIDVFAECLKHNSGGFRSRAGALREAAHLDLWPVPDPEADGDLILSADVRNGHNGDELREIEHLIEQDCDRCGHDRATRTYESFYSETAETVRCRACGFVIEHWDSL